MAQRDSKPPQGKLTGQAIINELIRNMELGQFEMGYSVLLPCVFSLYLHPDDHARLAGVFDLIQEDAKRALRAPVAQLNNPPTLMGLKRPGRQSKEYKIACRDVCLEVLPHTQGSCPLGGQEIHSEL